MNILLKRMLMSAGAIAVLGSAFFLKSAFMQPSVQLGMDDNGLSSVRLDKAELLRDGRFRASQVLLKHPNGTTSPGSLAGTQTVDREARTVTTQYPWGKVKTTYRAEDNRLDLRIQVTNTSATDTIQGLCFEPFTLAFPTKLEEYDGSIPLLAHNVGDLSLLNVSWDAGSLAVVNEDLRKPLLLGFPWATNRPANTEFPFRVSTDRVESYPDSYPTIHRAIAPSATDEFHVTLRFGKSSDSTETLASDMYRKYAQAFPHELDWKDRRPIGAIFLASVEGDWAKNPRGWLSDPTIDVTTKEGVADLHKKVMALADMSVKIMDEMDAQGAITWDIEGQEYSHAISYLGDPRQLDRVAPEMVGIADEYFRRIRDAGFRVGVSIRPQQLLFQPDGSPKQQALPDPTQLLIDKIKYARDRWGVSLVYLDSNVNATDPNPTDAAVLRKVHAAFPDVLLIPEHANLEYYSFTAPYKELRQGFTSTPEMVRSIYPRAYTVISTMDGPLDFHRKALMAAVNQGDGVLYRTWYPDPLNTKVKAFYVK